MLAAALCARAAFAHDDGSMADSPLKPWFDRLASGKGLCCSFADGVAIGDVDWDADGQGHYRVRICARLPVKANGVVDASRRAWLSCAVKTWVTVPDDAVITEPNKAGQAIVWPYVDATGSLMIRCFIPGPGT